MKTRSYLSFVLAGMFMIAFASPALAQKGMPMGQGSMAHHPMGASMDLTPAQQQAMQKIHDAHQDAFARLHKQLWAKNLQLKAALAEDKVDEGKVKAIAGDIKKLRSNLYDEQVNMWIELSKAGLAYHALGGGGMMGGGMMGMGMGRGMMGQGMQGGCPMMDD